MCSASGSEGPSRAGGTSEGVGSRLYSPPVPPDVDVNQTFGTDADAAVVEARALIAQDFDALGLPPPTMLQAQVARRVAC